MMGVGVASGAVVSFAAQVARPAVEKQIARAALTKTAWYGPMKQVLRLIGVKLTKQTLANTVSKAVPVVGGVVSGGMTMVTLDTQSKRLMRHLREIPPPNVDAAQYMAALRELDDREPSRLQSMGEAVGAVASGMVDPFRAVDLDGDGIPDEPRAMTAAKRGVTAAFGGLARASARVRRGRGETPAGGDAPAADETAEGSPEDDSVE